MKRLALTLLLALMQASATVPPKTADPSNGARQNVAKHPSSDKTPAQQTPPIVQPISAQPNQDTSHGPAAEAAQKPIIVRELPPVSVLRDWIDYLTLAFSATLLLVGIFGVRAAYRTLRAVESQAGIMQGQLSQMKASGEQTDELIKQAKAQVKELKDSTDVALTAAENAVLQTRAIINSERPWISVSQTLDESGNFELFAAVIGRTPAMILEGWGEYPIKYPDYESMPEEPPYAHPDKSKVVPYDMIVAPGDKPFSVYTASVARFLHPLIVKLSGEYDDLVEQREIMFFWGKIVYSDLLATDEAGNPVRHETRWCFRYVPGAPGKAGFCVRAGKRAWNRCT